MAKSKYNMQHSDKYREENGIIVCNRCQKEKKKCYCNVGRPPKYKSPEEMQVKIDEFLKYCKDNNKPKTVEMLLWHLGLTHHGFYDYLVKPEFSQLLRQIRMLIKADMVENALTGQTSTAFSMFLLKNFKDEKGEHEYREKPKDETQKNTTNNIVVVNYSKEDGLKPSLPEPEKKKNVPKGSWHSQKMEEEKRIVIDEEDVIEG